MASHYLQGELTIFAPSDRAMRKYTGPKDENFILNHMGEFDEAALPAWTSLHARDACKDTSASIL